MSLSRDDDMRALPLEMYPPHETQSLADRLESERLREQSAAIDESSIAFVESLGLHDGSVIVIAGAGDSTDFARSVRDRLRLNPVCNDIRPSAVEVHRLAGLEAEQINVGEGLMGSYSGAHAVAVRSVLGWMAEPKRAGSSMSEQQSHALHSIFGGMGAESRAVIEEYDWSTMSGPDSFMSLASTVLGIVRAGGFDPAYGARLATDVARTVDQLGLGGELEVKVYRNELSPTNKCRFIELTTLTLIQKLREGGSAEVADELEQLLELMLEEAASQSSFESVTMPDLVSVVVRPIEPEIQSTAVSSENLRRSMARPVMKVIANGELGQPELLPGVRIIDLTSTDADDSRKTLGRAYLEARYVDSLTPEGFLPESVDPLDYRLRSKGFYIPGAATGRIMEQDASGLLSLPCLRRYQEAYADALEHEIFTDPSAVVEFMCLAFERSGFRAEHLSVIVAAAIEHARQQGKDYVVAGITKKAHGMMKRQWGNALKPLAVASAGEDPAEVYVREGYTQDGIPVVMYYASTKTFVEEVCAHNRANGGEVSRHVLDALDPLHRQLTGLPARAETL